ncbi:MAG: substrate-binding domain-containing protein [Lachnospiraceae bacterium]|nr:substrate-binding domain-containing protein [Lachnospiraceae bacterium]
MKKKLVVALLSLTLVGTLLMGCGGNGGDTTTDDTTTETADNGGDDGAADADTNDAPAGGGENIQIVSKGFQHQFWQAVLQGAEEAAEELGVTINFVGPNSESDIADQVQMFQNAINQHPAAIGLAALDTEALLDGIAQAQAEGIPIIGFDSGVPDAPAGSILANASTDNYAAGQLAANEGWNAGIRDRVVNANGSVRIGVLSQDATSESIINRGLGFIDQIATLVEAEGLTVSITGNTRYVNDSAVEETGEGGDVIIEVLVPSQVTNELSAIDMQTLLNKEDTIVIYGSNQHSGEAMVTGNATIQRLGVGADDVLGIAFDSGATIKQAIRDQLFMGAVTQAPVAMGQAVVQLAVAAARGETVSDVDTGAQWYTADTIDNPEIYQNLYD